MAEEASLSRASDFPPEILSLFDRFVHGAISRDAFLANAEPFTPVGHSSEDVLAALSPDFERGRRTAPDDPRLRVAYVDIPDGPDRAGLRGYLVRPREEQRAEHPTVLVVHENRGLNPHIEDVARRLALEGFIALAPDALTPVGGYPGNEDRARELFAGLDRQDVIRSFEEAARFAQTLPAANGRLAVIGFCFGGGVAGQLATRLPELDAAISFYGSAPPLDQVPAIRASLQIHFASSDERINAAWPDYQEELDRVGIGYEAYHYPDTQHGFHNDTTPRFEPTAAALAWRRTIDFLRRNLS